MITVIRVADPIRVLTLTSGQIIRTLGSLRFRSGARFSTDNTSWFDVRVEEELRRIRPRTAITCSSTVITGYGFMKLHQSREGMAGEHGITTDQCSDEQVAIRRSKEDARKGEPRMAFAAMASMYWRWRIIGHSRRHAYGSSVETSRSSDQSVYRSPQSLDSETKRYLAIFASIFRRLSPASPVFA